MSQDKKEDLKETRQNAMSMTENKFVKLSSVEESKEPAPTEKKLEKKVSEKLVDLTKELEHITNEDLQRTHKLIPEDIPDDDVSDVDLEELWEIQAES